jgi:hypothetical protein
MSKTFRTWNIDEPQLLPPTVQDFVAKSGERRGYSVSCGRDDRLLRFAH